jgi:hypothetical protein
MRRPLVPNAAATLSFLQSPPISSHDRDTNRPDGTNVGALRHVDRLRYSSPPRGPCIVNRISLLVDLKGVGTP